MATSIMDSKTVKDTNETSMITLEKFKQLLDTPPTLKAIAISYIGRNADDIGQWVVNLSIKSTDEQCFQVEKVLGELLIADIEDDRRLLIMQQLQNVINRLVSQLHSEYLPELPSKNATQKNWIDSVNSLYYLSILVYQGILRRSRQQASHTPAQNNWTARIAAKLAAPSKSSQIGLIAMYHIVGLYLKLLMEQATAYQNPPILFWQQLNELFFVALQEDSANTRIHRQYATTQADTIQDFYCQACLYHLLRPTSYRRQDINGIHKMLSTWARHVELTNLPDIDVKTFINLHEKTPPEYLTPHTKINPYKEDSLCLFIVLTHLKHTLTDIQNNTFNTQEASVYERRLAKMALYNLNNLSYQQREEPRAPSTEAATLIVGFHRIHYQLAGRITFGRLIQRDQLERHYQPTSNHTQNRDDLRLSFTVQIKDKSTSGYRIASEKQSNEAATNFLTAALKIHGLFILKSESDKNTETTNHWQLGSFRWIRHESEHIEAGCRLSGFAITACGVRLTNNDGRSQDFVPALLVAGNDILKTQATLILPRYHFRENDKIVLRIGNKQTTLRLKNNLLSMDDIEQYHIAKLVSSEQ